MRESLAAQRPRREGSQREGLNRPEILTRLPPRYRSSNNLKPLGELDLRHVHRFAEEPRLLTRERRSIANNELCELPTRRFDGLSFENDVPAVPTDERRSLIQQDAVESKQRSYVVLLRKPRSKRPFLASRATDHMNLLENGDDHQSASEMIDERFDSYRGFLPLVIRPGDTPHRAIRQPPTVGHVGHASGRVLDGVSDRPIAHVPVLQQASRKLWCTGSRVSAPRPCPRWSGRARQAEHRSVAGPGKALVATQGFRLSGVPHGLDLYRHRPPW